MPKSNYIIEVKDIWKTYMKKAAETHALRGASAKIKHGDYVALFGPSGSGKSTLMHIMGCLDSPTKGKVFLDGRDVSKLSSDELAMVRRDKIGFIFQSYNLIQGFTAIENVALPLRFKGLSKSKAEEKAKSMLKKVGLGDRMTHRPNELSGGQQQRVAIARALINDPEIILADEPTGNLDTKSGDEIVKILAKLHKAMGKTILVVTHDPDLAKKADHHILIKDGKIQTGADKKKGWFDSV